MLLAPAYASAGPVNEEGGPLQLDVAPTPTVATIAPTGRGDEGGTAAGPPSRSSIPSTTARPENGVGMLDPLVVLGPLAGLCVVAGGTALVRVARASRANHDPRGAVDARS